MHKLEFLFKALGMFMVLCVLEHRRQNWVQKNVMLEQFSACS